MGVTELHGSQQLHRARGIAEGRNVLLEATARAHRSQLSGAVDQHRNRIVRTSGGPSNPGDERVRIGESNPNPVAFPGLPVHTGMPDVDVVTALIRPVTRPLTNADIPVPGDVLQGGGPN